jgi:sulfotransferase
MKMNVVTGLPRSGSTLMCNVLNQNPKFHATSTSVLPMMLNSVVSVWSSSLEVKNLLNIKKEETEKRMQDSLSAFVQNWHKQDGKEVVFDKSRGWNSNEPILHELFPESKMIVMVRDLRNIFSSIEKQNSKSPLVVESVDPVEKTLYNRADVMFGPQGLVGGSLVGIEDLMRRKPDGVIYVNYEYFAKNPAMVMERIYSELNEEGFKHDFDNVENTANDPDGFYLNKYPHKGEGKVEPSDQEEWKKYVSDDIANLIMEKFGFYNQFFGYK